MKNRPDHSRELLPSSCVGVALWNRVGSALRHGELRGELNQPAWKWQFKSENEIWLWLNWEGEGLLWGERDRVYLRPGLFALTGGDALGRWECRRSCGRHHLQMVRICGEWLRERLETADGLVHPGLQSWGRKGGNVSFCGLMGMWEKDLRDCLTRPRSTPIWMEAGILQWAARRLCPEETSEQKVHHFPDQDVVGHVLLQLRAAMDQPLDLALLGKKVGVSPHHLSRLVKARTGVTLQWHLRKMRIDHACELLSSHRCNVTEAAYACGYQSLSHFAKAFREEVGENPKHWLLRRRG